MLGGTNAQAAEEVVTPVTADAGKNIKTDIAEKVNTSKLTEAIERFSQLLDKVAETDKNNCNYYCSKKNY